MKLKLEKRIPIPTPKATGLTEIMRQMKVGDSFMLPVTGCIRSTVYVQATRLGMKVTARKNGTSLRVWRVS